ncbi:MAG: tetratricopeptide repeat protein, partial [Rhodospirillales bacterium]|nr:tetratricopeptide repeat protein [Rhodospirillales bacterium]
SAYPDNLPAKGLLASSLQAQGRGAEAAPLLEQIAAAKPGSLDVQTAVGVELLRARETSKGLAVLAQTVERAPDAPLANFGVIAALIQEKRFDEALAAAERFHEQDRNNVTALRLLGTAQLAKGDRKGADASFRKALEVAPGDPTTSVIFAELMSRDGDLDGARKVLEEASRLYPNDAGLLAVLGYIAMRQERTADATDLLRRALSKDPEHRRSQLLLSQVLLAQNDPRGALAVLPTERDLKDPQRLALRADAHSRLEEFSTAKEDLERLAALLPGNAEVHFRLAAAYEATGERGRMEKSLETAASLAPTDASIVLARARALAASGKFDEAAALAKKLGLPESDLRRLATELVIANARGDAAERLRVVEKIQEVQPSPQNLVLLAQAQAAAGHAEAAERALKGWLDRHRDADVVAIELAALYGRTGRPSEAAELLRPLVQKYPDNVGVLNNLAWYLRDSDPREALALAQRAHEAAPENLAVVDTYVAVLVANTEFAKALRAVDGAIERAREPAYFRLQRVEILERSGDRVKAEEELAVLKSAGVPPALQGRVDAVGQRLGGP